MEIGIDNKTKKEIIVTLSDNEASSIASIVNLAESEFNNTKYFQHKIELTHEQVGELNYAEDISVVIWFTREPQVDTDE